MHANERRAAVRPAADGGAVRNGTDVDDDAGIDVRICGACVVDGTGAPAFDADVIIRGDRIVRVETCAARHAASRHPASRHAATPRGAVIDAHGLVLAPGFIDAHTHDDTVVIDAPAMQPKITQGVTTVVVGNCGISAAPVTLRQARPPDPMNLLGDMRAFRYPSFADYARAVEAASPAVNVVALVGHTSLRSGQMDRFDRAATHDEIVAMRARLQQALDEGAIGLSTGLAYPNARAAPIDEVLALATTLKDAGGLYCTHLRTEADGIVDAMREAFEVGRRAGVPVVISHLKCAGLANQGRSAEILAELDRARQLQPVGCDCYPYAASSTTIDPAQVNDRTDVMITWSTPHPERAGQLVAQIAADWGVTPKEAAVRLQPGGAVYHCMRHDDVERILAHPATVVGSDGLPCDPRPHPRLWGSFARVLGHYVRDVRLFPLEAAVHKMTGQTASRYGLEDRGIVRPGAMADLVLFDAAQVADEATYDDSRRPARGIHAVWVNGVPTLLDARVTGRRAGRMLRRLGARA